MLCDMIWYDFTTAAVDSAVTEAEWQEPSLSFTFEKDTALSTTKRTLYLIILL